MIFPRGEIVTLQTPPGRSFSHQLRAFLTPWSAFLPSDVGISQPFVTFSFEMRYPFSLPHSPLLADAKVFELPPTSPRHASRYPSSPPSLLSWLTPGEGEQEFRKIRISSNTCGIFSQCYLQKSAKFEFPSSEDALPGRGHVHFHRHSYAQVRRSPPPPSFQDRRNQQSNCPPGIEGGIYNPPIAGCEALPIISFPMMWIACEGILHLERR